MVGAEKGQSWKAQMKSDMDDAIRKAYSFDDFISRMQSKGYGVKGETNIDKIYEMLQSTVTYRKTRGINEKKEKDNEYKHKK